MGMWRSKSEKNGVMHVQRMVKKRKTGKSPLEKEARTGAHVIKDDNIVDENELTVSSTLWGVRKTVMSILVTKLASLCSIQAQELRNLVKKHELGFGEPQSEKGNIFWPTLRTTFEGI